METDENVVELNLAGRFKDFLWSFRDEKTKSFKYRERISQMALMNQKSLIIDFDDITVYDRKLASILQQKPNEAMDALSHAIKEIVRKEFPDYAETIERFYPRLRRLTRVLSIRELNSDYIGQMIAVEGIVTRVTPIEVKLVRGRFKHVDPECGQEFDYPEKGEMGERLEKPGFCIQCGRTGRFELIVEKSKFIDWQKIVIQERPEVTPPGQIPRSIEVVLTGDIVDSTRPGDRVTITGVLKVLTTSGAVKGTGRSVFSMYVDANHVEVQQKILEEVDISREDEEKIRELARNPWIREMIVASIAPSIYGHTNIKEAIALLLFGGVPKELPDGTRIRGDIHVLLVGDPGTAKSQLLQYTSKIAPRGLYTSGKGSTAAGLTATVLRDKTSGEYYLEAGAMVLADGGVACLHPGTRVLVDNEYVEIEKLFSEDKSFEARSNGHLLWINEFKGKVAALNASDLTSREAFSTLISRKRWRDKLVKIVFDSGHKLMLTPDHLLLDGEELVWRRAGDFKPGDKVVSLLRIPGHGEDIYIIDIIPSDAFVVLEETERDEFLELVSHSLGSLSDSFNPNFVYSDWLPHNGFYVKAGLFREVLVKSNAYKEWRDRILTYLINGLTERLTIAKITPELGYLIGFLYDKLSSADNNVVNFTLFDREVYSKIIDLVATVGAKAFVREAWHNGASRQAFELSIKSPLLIWIVRYFTEDGLRRIFKLPDRVLKAFVAGLIDSRGFITYSNDSDSSSCTKAKIRIEFRDERDAETVSLVLRRMDLYSRIYRCNGSVFIEIPGWKDVAKLLENIKPFTAKNQQVTITNSSIDNEASHEQLPRVLSINILKRIVDFIEQRRITDFRIWNPILNVSNDNAILTKTMVNDLLNKLNIVDESLSSEIKSALGFDYYIDTIASIEYLDYDGYVYDLYVPEVNNFLAEGVIVHNCIDEIDKMRDEDRQAIHEALEQQTVSIAKAGIVARLNARASVLAAGNPKYGRYDLNEPIGKNIDLPPTILSRFDLIFVIQDIPDKTRDHYLAKHVLEIHADADRVKPFIDPILLKKYVSYARRYIRPRLTDDAKKMIEEFYVKMRMAGLTSKEGGTSTVPITPRQLEALVRLTEAYAKMALKTRATAEDAEEAIRLMYYTLRRIGFDIETGVFDIDIIETGLPRSKMQKIKEFNKFLFEEVFRKYSKVSKKDLFRLAEEKGFDKEFVEEMLEKLHREGLIIYPPGADYVSKA